MYNRAEIIDKNFSSRVKKGELPPARIPTKPYQTELKEKEWIDLFESQIISRHLDLEARNLKQENECFYTIGSSGHEGNVVYGKVFRTTDLAFLHYRSGGFMVQRFKQKIGSTPLYDLMLSFVASSEEPIAGGRHKVFGSKELNVPPQTSTIASHLPKAVGAALSIGRTKDLDLESEFPQDSVVVCSFGDASANHATALSAINTATWSAYQNIKVPIVFICEDNGIGISVPTANNWIEDNFSQRPELFYIQADGLNLADLFVKTKQAERIARKRKKPVFLHVRTVRLMGHAGSDVESTYRNLQQIEMDEFNDPLLHTANMILEQKWMSSNEIVDMYEHLRQQIKSVGEEAKLRPKLLSPEDVKSTVVSCAQPRKSPSLPSEEKRMEVFGREYKNLKQPAHMAKLINWGLTDILMQYPQSLVFGEDVAQKGGVYHVTDNLMKRFSQKRVFNSPLDETSIIGAAMGFAHNGFLPIPEIQFLAYVHNAEDQIRGEASTLQFFSQGQFSNPMVLRIAGLAYQKGFGGHFHNDNSLNVFRDIPGLVVAVPSNGADAVRMLRTCTKLAYEQGRVCIFVEPIALYMTKDLHSQGDKDWSFEYPALGETCDLGKIGTEGSGKDLLIISYGNGYHYSLKAAKILEDKHRIKSTVLDIRWIAPLNMESILAHANEFKDILIVDECRKTGSVNEQICAGIVENLNTVPNVKVVAADDCFIPLGVAAAAGLPKTEEILEGALNLLKVDPT